MPAVLTRRPVKKKTVPTPTDSAMGLRTNYVIKNTMAFRSLYLVIMRNSTYLQSVKPVGDTKTERVSCQNKVPAFCATNNIFILSIVSIYTGNYIGPWHIQIFFAFRYEIKNNLQLQSVPSIDCVQVVSTGCHRQCQWKCSTGEHSNKITNRTGMQLQEQCDTLLMWNGHWQNTS
jgi:hypothetical protein